MSEDTSSAQPHRPTKRPIWAKAFLAALRKTGNVRKAAELAKIRRNTPSDYFRQHPGSALEAEYREAVEEYADRLEEEADRRAFEGVDEPVYGRVGKDQDGQIGTIRKYSDTLLIFRLKALRPDKYRERYDHRLDIGRTLDKLAAETGLPKEELLAEARRLTGDSQ